MRLVVLGPGHVLLRDRPARRWVLLVLAVPLAWWALDSAFRLGFTGGPLLGAALAGLLLVGGVVAARRGAELEIRPDGLRFGPTPASGMRDEGPLLARELAIAVRLYAGVVPGTLGKESPPRATYEVELLCGPPLPRALALFCSPREVQARRFAHALCRAAVLPLFDDTGEPAMLRPPDALDGPPPGRAAPPIGPPPPGVRIDPDPIWGEVATLARWTGARTVLHVADGELRVARGWATVPLRRRRLPVGGILRVRVQRRWGEDGPGGSRHLRAGVAIVTARRTVVVGGWLAPAARQWVAAWLEARLWPEVPAGRGNESVPARAAAVAL